MSATANVAACAAFTARASAGRSAMTSNEAALPRVAKEATVLVELSIILALVIVNGVFAAAEISVVSLRGSRLEAMIAAGSSRARAVQRLRKDPERFLATVQIGITVVGAVASAFGGASVAEDLIPLIEPLPWLGPHAATVAIGLVVALVSYLSLVLGELIPKSLALRFGEPYALWVNRALDLALPEGEGWSTVAGLCLELTGRIPATGEVLRTPDGTTLEIADAIPRQVRRVRLRRRAAKEASEPGGEPPAFGEGES
ncbi:hypothetical protein BE21_19100 [Sorangium cellulosum]|uniref:CNNM transmembrane domain-containing protein n=1 Tax=Sorangium cellulosum TaxID=56 RepID=A0A150TXP0_SORCE|nr:hypothetical protein BE21_19100 [Sorangium cellulosum]